MQRIKIDLPESFGFSTIVRIRITDLNYGGHVGNDSFLSLIHEARQQFLQHFGYSELQLEDVSLIMADAAIEFKKELNYGDEVKISVAAAGFDKFGFDIFYKLEVMQNEAAALAGKAKTGMLCFDYANKKIKAVPEKAIAALSNV
jgi:YbgC/YbaW family acyl-CoA thioester hydrolase